MSKVATVHEAVGRIPDEAVVSVSSSSTLGCPDAVLKAIGERFDAEGHPRGITSLHPIAAGDVYDMKQKTILKSNSLVVPKNILTTF